MAGGLDHTHINMGVSVPTKNRRVTWKKIRFVSLAPHRGRGEHKARATLTWIGLLEKPGKTKHIPQVRGLTQFGKICLIT